MSRDIDNFLRDKVYPKIHIYQLVALKPLIRSPHKSECSIDCPSCGQTMHHHKGRGDVTCINCGNWSLFDLHLALGFTSEFALRSLCDAVSERLPAWCFTADAFWSRLKTLKNVLNREAVYLQTLVSQGAIPEKIPHVNIGGWSPGHNSSGEYKSILEPSFVVPFFGKFGLNLAYISLDEVAKFDVGNLISTKFVNPEPWPILFRRHKNNTKSQSEPLVTSHLLLAIYLLSFGMPCLYIHRACHYSDPCYALSGDPVIRFANLPCVNLINFGSLRLFEIAERLLEAWKGSSMPVAQVTLDASTDNMTAQDVVEFVVLRALQGTVDTDVICNELAAKGVQLCIQQR
ncbi:hypothetical protein [Motilimonas eburnea]|uniref:hypothetical protein n=1 Tax=Motilimonas eburnea TaxID=1737488 RepID=UPI001E3BFD02|nr:hypothetical protein [Motilimonas eburnea]MCE2571786.1 hypothetical protein [Motilimonas eburnea]